MATVTLSLTDTPKGVKVNIKFDPPIEGADDNEMATEAQSIGAELIDHLADIWAADDEVDEVN
jgi:hypothetical protein